MKNKLVLFLIFIVFLGGCLNEKTEVNFISVISEMIQTQDIHVDNTAIIERKSSESIHVQVIKVEWKAIFEEEGDYFHLYVTVNGEKNYYAGGYWPGVNFELNENSYVSDAPKNALATLSTLWTGEGQWFYIYKKSDVELVVMNHPVIYPEWYIQAVKKETGNKAYVKQYEEYKEVLNIPIEKGSHVQIEKSIIIQKPEVCSVG